MSKLIEEIETIKPEKVWIWSTAEKIILQDEDYTSIEYYTIEFGNWGSFVPVYLSLKELFDDKLVLDYTCLVLSNNPSNLEIKISCVDLAEIEKLASQNEDCEGIIVRPENNIYKFK